MDLGWLLRNCKPEFAALSDAAVHTDSPAMLNNDRLANRQSQTNALPLTGIFGAHLLESLENLFKLILGNALSVIGNG